jgi:MFS family permease
MRTHGKQTPQPGAGAADRHDRTSYLAELRLNRGALAAASVGLGAGFLLNHYVANLFAPHLIAEFGWSRSHFALIGAAGLLNLFIFPLVGRLTDVLGARPVALVGVVAYPLTFLALSLMSGSFGAFAVITVLQIVLVGTTTTSTVYTRLVAERFDSARGLALAIAATMPALVGVIGSPLLQHVIDAHGWRAGYLATGVFVGVAGLTAILLIPRTATGHSPGRPGPGRNWTARRRKASQDYAQVLASGPFWVISGGLLLCTLLYPLQSSQMNLMLIEKGANPAFAAWMVSLFAAGVMLGRFFCGVALDRLPAHLVAAVALGLPGIGIFVIASGLASPVALAAAVMLFGLSLGAESDLAAYLVMRYFPFEVYGTVLGLVVTCMALSAALGAVLLSFTLRLTDTFDMYMLIAGAASLAGGSLFLLLGRAAPAAADEMLHRAG